MPRQIYYFCGRFLVILPVVVFFGCQTTIHVERPVEDYPEMVETAPPVSYINIPLEFDVKKLESLFNRQFRGLVYSDTSFDDNDHDNLRLKAYKTEDIRLSVEGSQLLYQVPLYVSIEKRFEIDALGYTLSDTREANASLVLKFRTKISFNRDWTVTSLTTSEGYEWKATPVMKLGPVSVPLPVISDAIVEGNLGTINKEIDKAIRSSIDLKSIVKKTWQDIQVPIEVSSDPPLWAKITPLEVATVPLQGSSGMIRHTIGIKASAELFYGSKPQYTVNDSLPALKIASRLDQDFQVGLLAGVPLDSIRSMAGKELRGYTYKQGKYTVTVDDVNIFGSEGNLIVAVSVSGSVRGILYLTGQPFYEQATSSIWIRNLDFELKTGNVLLKSAAWLFHGGLVKALVRKLEFPAGERLQQVRKELQDYLDSRPRLGYFILSGTIDDVAIENIRITPSSLKTLITFRGTLNVSLAD